MRNLACCVTVLVAASCILAGSGCASSSPPKPKHNPWFSREGPIEEIHLFGDPVALRLDNSAAASGVGLRIYASSSRVARGLRIKSGTLEVVMFDGVASAVLAESQPKPRHVWSLKPAQLDEFESETTFGIGYRLALPWGEDKPTKGSVTLIARYIPPNGQPVYSSASTIALGAK